MKLGLIGDIHGNQFALQAVLQAAAASKVNSLLVTGDLVGYYFGPLQVLELLNDWNCYIVRGNHEEMLSKARTDKNYLKTVEAHYGTGVSVAIEQLSSKQLESLCSLPHPLELDINANRILLSHGAPWGIDHYIYSDADQMMLETCLSQNFDLIVMGHTHYPMLKQIGSTVIVNPGSVGQQRDRIPGACWAIYDTSSGFVEFRRESYEAEKLILECMIRHPELPYLSEVLTRT